MQVAQWVQKSTRSDSSDSSGEKKPRCRDQMIKLKRKKDMGTEMHYKLKAYFKDKV